MNLKKITTGTIHTLFTFFLAGLLHAQNNPPTNTPPPGIVIWDPEDRCECTSCSEQTAADNYSVSFSQGFGRSPWISGAPKGTLRIYESSPSQKLGTRAMLCYDHPLSSRVIRRDSALHEITVQDGLARKTVYDRYGKPKLTAYGRNRQCLLKGEAEVVEVFELLMDRTCIGYGSDNSPSRIITAEGVQAPVADFGIDVVKDLGGIRQIWSRADGLLDMTEPSTNSVLVTWYPPSAVAQQPGTNGLYTFSGNPVKTFTFRFSTQAVKRLVSGPPCPVCATGIGYHIRACDSVYESTGEESACLILEERRGTEFLFQYEWKYLPGNGAWTLVRGEGADAVTDSLVRPPDIYPGRISQTRTTATGDGRPASVTKELYSYDYLGYRLLKKSAVLPDGQEQVLYEAARIDQGANAGRFSAATNAYGGAESYIYDSDGRMIRETKTVHGGVTQVTTKTYASARDANGFVDRRPLRTVVTQNGVAVSDTAFFHVYESPTPTIGMPPGRFDTVTRTDPKTGAILKSYSFYLSSYLGGSLQRGRINYVLNPDGSAAHYAYAEGENGSWTETVTQGYWEPPSGDPDSLPTDVQQIFRFYVLPGKSTRTVNTHDFRGDIVRTDSYVHAGTEFTLAGWETHSYNIMHKKIGTTRHDGTSEMSNWICTGPVWQRNADGTSVTNTFDTAKRIKTSTRYTPFGNVATTYNYDADGHVVSQSVATNGINTGMASSTVYDTQGRAILSVDAMGRTNRTAYSADNRTVTRTDPSGAVAVENYATDGSLLSRTGTVMRAEYYTQGVDAATGTRWERTTYGSPSGTDYTKSYYNALNQLVLQERPGFGGATLKTVYAYNTKGQLESETRLVQGGTGTYDLPVTTYAYSQLGDRVATTQAVANVSRVQSSDSAFTLDNGIVQQTSISVQSCSDATIPAITNSAITRLYPLENGLLAENRQRDVRGNETVQTVTQNPATYIRTAAVSNATSVLPAISISLAGLTLSQTDQHGCTTIYGYDALMRQISAETRSGQNNERLTGTYTHYNVIGQVDCTEDTFGSRTVYGYDSTGRRISTAQVGKPTDPVLTTYTTYDSANRTLATWGATYPVAYEYDTAGRMIAMYTYRGTTAIASYSDIAALKPQMDRTQWFYDQAAGLLTNKLYADGKGPSYSYTALGQLSTRAWARPSGTGQQLLTLYGYDNFGSLTNTDYSDGTPSIFLTYDAMGRQKVAQTFLPLTGEIVSSTTNIYSGLDLVAEIQNGVRIDRQVDAFGRQKGLTIGTDYTVEYGFDEYGCFGSVTSTVNSVVNNWQYGYLPGSHLIASVDHPSYSARKTFENSRDLITTVSNTFGTATISAFGYENDGFGRRTARVDTTPTLTVNNAFGYNLRSEVTSAMMANGDSSYDYDPVGNRVFSSLNAETNTYSANALNQYSNIVTSASSAPLRETNPIYDLDGNLLTNGVWSYSWDAENRLTAVRSNNTLLVSNVYDHQSRRIVKTTSEGTRTFIWDAWNPIRELITDNGSLTTNSFTWGFDLSGSLQGAGGVGGLLAVNRDSAVYFPCFDANGNITEYMDASGTLRAHFAFDAFGNTISQSGDLAATFNYRFSTKYADEETGLCYYGYRFYSLSLARWISRDPIGETGGTLLYGLLNNNSLNYTDILGLMTVVHTFLEQEIQPYVKTWEYCQCDYKCDKATGKFYKCEPCKWVQLGTGGNVEIVKRTVWTKYGDSWNRQEESEKLAAQILEYGKSKAGGVLLEGLLKAIFGKDIPTGIPYEDEAKLTNFLLNYLTAPLGKIEYPKKSGTYYTVERGILSLTREYLAAERADYNSKPCNLANAGKGVDVYKKSGEAFLRNINADLEALK